MSYLTEFNNDVSLIPVLNAVAVNNGAAFDGITVNSFNVIAWYACADDADEEEATKIEGKLAASILELTKHKVTVKHIQPVTRYLIRVSIEK